MSERATATVAQRIVRAARDLFATKGFADTRTRQIAAAAGTSESGVFRYFADKNSLMRAAYNDAWADLNRYVDQAVEAAGPFPDPLTEIECVARAFWSYYERDSLTTGERRVLDEPEVASGGSPDTVPEDGGAAVGVA